MLFSLKLIHTINKFIICSQVITFYNISEEFYQSIENIVYDAFIINVICINYQLLIRRIEFQKINSIKLFQIKMFIPIHIVSSAVTLKISKLLYSMST
jgi:hypothetical protein